MKQATLRPADDAWVVLVEARGWRASANIPTELRAELVGLASQSSVTLKSVALAPNDGWVILYGANDVRARNAPQSLFNRLTQLKSQGQTLKSVAIGPGGGWVVLFGTDNFAAENAPATLVNQLNALRNRGHNFKAVTLGADGRWAFLLNQNGYFVSTAPAVPTGLTDALTTAQNNGATATSIALGRSASYGLTFNVNGFAVGPTRVYRPSRR